MQKYKRNDMIEACINSWTYVRNSSRFPKIFAEWWDCESIGTLESALEVKIFSSFAHSCPTLWDPMDCSKLGCPVHYQLPELAQTHIHRVSDAIQPSHSLSSPSPPAFNLSQHQGLFFIIISQFSGGQSIEVSASTSVLKMNIQDWFPLGWMVGSPCSQSKGISRVSRSTTVQKHQFFGTQLSL